MLADCGLKPADIATMDPRQVRAIYSHPRDKQGRVIVDQPGDLSDEGIFIGRCRDRGYTTDEAMAMWQRNVSRSDDHAR